MKSHKTLAALVLLIAACLAGTACNQKSKEEPKKVDPMLTEGRRTDQAEGWLFHQKDEKFHIRLKVDPGKKEATARILDSDAKEEVPITADTIRVDLLQVKPAKQVELKAQRKGKGSTPLFTGTDDAFMGKLDPAKIEIQATIDTKVYVFVLDKSHK
jgi:hypothetical protein